MIQARRLDSTAAPELRTDRDLLARYLEDASGIPPGVSAGVVVPESVAAAAEFLRQAVVDDRRVLFQAARSSLTGGAVPWGETVLSVERLDQIGALERHGAGARVRVGAGVPLDRLERTLAERGFYYPPVPTYRQAMIGGVVSTNAGGAATFKYGVTRDWVHGLRVLLADGEMLELERGAALARRGEFFRIRHMDGRISSVPVPEHRLPALRKVSAGYHAAPPGDPLDLIDLFVGSEGTLGLIVEATLKLVPQPAAVLRGMIAVERPGEDLALAASLRRMRWDGLELRAIEWLDRNCLRALHRRGVPRQLELDLPETAEAVLLFEIELARPWYKDTRSLERLLATIEAHVPAERVALAPPGDLRRARQLEAFREAAPSGFSELLAERRREDEAVSKVGGDLIVPFEELSGMIEAYREGFGRRGLEYAIWGHLSDGNLHPNALPRTAAEMRLAQQALLEFADEAVRRGGAPLAEHGVGRSLLKQEMLRRFVGVAAIERMRQIKRALDPRGRLAPGVLFPLVDKH